MLFTTSKVNYAKDDYSVVKKVQFDFYTLQNDDNHVIVYYYKEFSLLPDPKISEKKTKPGNIKEIAK